MEFAVIILLIILNGIFSMSETAIVSSRKSHLQLLAQDGNKRAQAALELAKSPTRFLSTVQIGITMIGIFAGVYGGAKIAENIAKALQVVPLLAPYSEFIALSIVVIIITFLSLILGELLPKRLALANPEKVAMIVARPMNSLSRIISPLVSLLSVSTDFLLDLFGVSSRDEATVSEEEVKMLIREGARLGIFNFAERDIVERTFRLSDKKVNTLMTPRKEIVSLDIKAKFEVLRNKISKNPHGHFPVCDGGLDKVIGVVRSEDILTSFLTDEKIDLHKFLRKPLFIPETMEALKVLELFKQSGTHMALIIDEYGGIMGLLTLTDVLEEIVGDIPAVDEGENDEIVKRDDGSYLLDGLVTIDEFKDYFKIKKLPGEATSDFQTVGGFVMSRLDRIPTPGDSFEWNEFYFEVMDMDVNRIDKILFRKIKK